MVTVAREPPPCNRGVEALPMSKEQEVPEGTGGTTGSELEPWEKE